jgi:ribosomal-protein-alanine N-acetyltransferase
MKIKAINSFTGPDSLFTNGKIASFLFKHLEQYGDPIDQIEMALAYVFRKNEGKGGHILLAVENETIIGATVINETGMGGYIPANILVYIAVDGNQRGKGVGKQLMAQATQICKGGIALHVEPDNPAKKLYEAIGFTNKYLEMRYEK